MGDSEYTNRLINEKSPYLLQHAHNPVDWYPWSEEAFEKAKKENKLVFLSIGYSTCHWCHVMERESFENEYVAREMNDLFVSIKVDREERPDIDSAYMTVSQMMTGTGGWPLNIIMTPKKVPVFALTYIPRESRRGMVGIIELTRQLKELWTQGPEEVERRAEEVLNNLRGVTYGKKGDAVNKETVESILTQLKSAYDNDNGGFGNAPKFPSLQNLMFLMRIYRKTGEKQLLDMVTRTLNSMRMGGIYDHVGYGFHRYSTDAGWFLPHFEKMIYDQAFMIMAYTEAYQLTGDQMYRDVVYEISDFLGREMTSKDGAFYSAIDADSENEEGKFYTWSATELYQILGKEDGDIFLSVFNADMSGNYLDEATGRNTGKNILYLNNTFDAEARRIGLEPEDLKQILDRSREKLFEAREKRIRPHVDDKILTDMNGLMVAAMAKAHRAFGEELFLEQSKKSAEFILDKLHEKGTLLHRYRDGESAINGYLDDYSFFTFGMIELFKSTMDAKYLETAQNLAKTAKTLFFDKGEGGFFETPKDGEELPVRMKEGHDGAIPSGNSIHMFNLLRLGTILSSDGFTEDGLSVANAFASNIQKGPMYHCFMGIGIDYALSESYLVKTWDANSEYDQVRDYSNKEFLPHVESVLLQSENKNLARLLDEPMSASTDNAHATIQVCTGNNCLPPVKTLDELKKIIG